MTYLLAYLLLSICTSALWFCLAQHTDEDDEMMTYTPTRRPLRLKLSAWVERTYLEWRVKHAERDVEHTELDRLAALEHADELKQRAKSYEAHITLLAQRLGRARWK